MRYRKKPVVIEAMQVTKEAMYEALFEEWSEGAVRVGRLSTFPNSTEVTGYVKVETLEGTMRGELGDWIIRGVQGEFYLCKPDIFEQTYELVEGLNVLPPSIRADWWREVTDPNAVIPKGCPARFEYRGFAQEMDMLEGSVAFEHVFDHVLKRDRIYENALLFIDSRWTPPRPAYKVGDVIEAVEDLERLPEGTLLFSNRLHAYWMEKEGHFVAIGSDRWLVADEAASYGPFTIRWLPEPEATK